MKYNVISNKIGESMKKKGFTLVELLATIIILGIIAIIAVPIISGTIKNSRNRAYALQVNRIKEQAKNWATANTDHLPSDATGFAFVSIDDLRIQGFIKDEDVLDPRTQELMDGCVSIQYDESNKQYTYEYHEETCNQMKENTYHIAFTADGIKDAEGKKDEVEVNTTYAFPIVTAVNSNGEKLNVTGPIIKQKGNDEILSTLDTSVLNRVYEITYSAFDYVNNVGSEVVIEVTVIDTTPPILTVDGHSSSYSMVIESEGTFVAPPYEASDNSGITPTVTTSGVVNMRIPGDYDITYVATDTKNNRTSLIVTVTVIDTTKPVITSVTGSPTTWTKNDVTLTINANDEGSGMHDTGYSCNGGATWQASNKCTVSSNQTVSISVRDKNGNVNSTSVVVDKIDKTTPGATFAFKSGTAGSNGWYKSNIVVTATPSAGNSGVASYKYCTTTGSSCTPSTSVSGSGATDVTISGESSTSKVCVQVTSGSTVTSGVICSGNYKIDKTAPTLNVDGHTSNYSVSYKQGAYAAPSTSATDNLTASPTITSSGSVNGSAVGTYYVTYTATDSAGNTHSVVRTVTITSACQGLSVNFHVNWTGKHHGDGYNECDLYIGGVRVVEARDCEGSYTVSRNVNGCTVTIRTKYNGHDESQSGRPNMCDVYFNGKWIDEGNCEYLNYTRTLSG